MNKKIKTGLIIGIIVIASLLIIPNALFPNYEFLPNSVIVKNI